MAHSHVLIFAVIGHNTINIPDMFKVFTIFKPPMQTSVVDPDLQIRGGGGGEGGGHPHPEIREGPFSQKFFSCTPASFWSKNRGAPMDQPLDVFRASSCVLQSPKNVCVGGYDFLSLTILININQCEERISC